MGGGGEAPQPSQEERNLNQAQADALREQNQILKQQYEEQQLLAPVLYKQAGLNPIRDAAGKITGFSDEPQTEEQKLQKDISLQLLRRSQSALKGELPVDPNLNTALTNEEKTLRDTLQQRLGPGWETSSAGIEALSQFGKRKEELLYSARRDELTTSEALQLQRQGSTNQMLFGGVQTAQQGPSTVAALFGQNAQGYGAAAGGMRQDRSLQFQSSASGAANKGALIGAGLGTAAAIAIAM
jgi:hypothetical protein